jgi:hypothetical protein
MHSGSIVNATKWDMEIDGLLQLYSMKYLDNEWWRKGKQSSRQPNFHSSDLHPERNSILIFPSIQTQNMRTTSGWLAEALYDAWEDALS